MSQPRLGLLQQIYIKDQVGMNIVTKNEYYWRGLNGGDHAGLGTHEQESKGGGRNHCRVTDIVHLMDSPTYHKK